MAKKWTGMNRIDHYCDKILEAMKTEDLSLLDLALCSARFETIAKLFQYTFDRTQEEVTIANEKRNK